MSSKDAIVNIDHPAYAGPMKEIITITEKEVPSTSQSSRPGAVRVNAQEALGMTSDDTLTKTGQWLYRLLENPIIRYSIYILPVASIIAIPLVLFATKYRDANADGIHYLGLFVYIEIIWVSLWIAKLMSASIPYIFQGLCGIISTGIRKYALVLRAVEIPMSIFIWTIMTLCWFPIIHVFDRDYYHSVTNDPTQGLASIQWLHIFRDVIRASIGSSALFLAEKMLMQLISVNYHGKQFRDKIKDIKYTTRAIDLLYEASLRKYADHHPDFYDEDVDIHDTTNVQKILRSYSADRSVLRVFGDIHYFGERLVAAFGRMASDITGTEVLRPTATHAIVEAALERGAGADALARRIFKSFVQKGADCVYERDLIVDLGPGSEKEASFIFAQLDRDGNGDVSLDEMIMLVTGISRQRKDMWKSACNVRDAIRVLDRVISFIVLVVIAFIYSAFFSDFLANNYSKIVTLLSASAFSFGQTVGEFNAACIQVFVKHPFDVGDRVNMNDNEYEVVRISLLYTIFRRIDHDTIVQVANNVVGNLWIDNVSRSKAMKERLQFAINAATSFQDIENLRAELQAFVAAPDNSRDYHADVEIQLMSVGDLKQLDLRVEVRHKSNWANDQLRAYRRSKFMCALLSAMRKVGIESPSGSAPAQGSINSPNFAVAISEDKAKEARTIYDADKAAKRYRPSERVMPDTQVTSSTGLEILPSLAKGFVVADDGLMNRPVFARAKN